MHDAENRPKSPSTRNPETGEVDVPRPLSETERGLITGLLSALDFPGRDALLDQIPRTVVQSYCACGCTSLDMTVVGGAPSIAPMNPLYAEGSIAEPRGVDEASTSIILWHRDGFLNGLEIISVGTITEFLPLDRWKFY